MEVWKIIFLSKWVICRFHVNLPGCIDAKIGDLEETTPLRYGYNRGIYVRFRGWSKMS